MSVLVYSVPGQTTGRRKAFLEWKSIDLSSELSLPCGSILTIIKVFIILFLLVRIENILSQKKRVSSVFNWVSRYALFLAKLKGRGRPFLKGARKGATLWDYPQEHLVVIRNEKVSPFCEIWNNPTSSLFFIRPPYK